MSHHAHILAVIKERSTMYNYITSRRRQIDIKKKKMCLYQYSLHQSPPSMRTTGQVICVITLSMSVNMAENMKL